MTGQQQEITKETALTITELAAKYNITIAKPVLHEEFAKSYLVQHRDVGVVLAAVLIAEEERIQQYRLLCEADRAARQGMSATELKMLPAPRQPISKEETYAPRWRVEEIVQGKIKWRDAPLRSAIDAGLVTDVLSYDSSGDSHVTGYRIPPKCREEVVALLLKWGNT